MRQKIKDVLSGIFLKFILFLLIAGISLCFVSCNRQEATEPQEIRYLLESINILLPLGTEGDTKSGEGMKLLWEGKYQEAQDLYKELVVEEESAEALNGLAISQYYLGGYIEAEKNLHLALEQIKDKNGEYALTNNLGVVLAALNKYDESDGCYKKILRDQNYPEEKSPLAEVCTLVNQAGNYADKGEVGGASMAEPLLLQAFDEAKGMRQQDPLLMAYLDDKLIALNYERVGLEKAIKKTLENMRIFEEVLGKEHPWKIFISDTMIQLRMVQGKWDVAVIMYKQIIEDYEQKLGDSHIYVARAYINLGFCCKYQKKYEEALENYKKALEINKQITSGPTESYLPYFDMASIYFGLGKHEEALEYALNAYRSLLKNNPYNTITLESIIRGLKIISNSMGVEEADFDEWLEEQMVIEKDIK